MRAASQREIRSAGSVWAPELSSTILRILGLDRQELRRSGLILSVILRKISVETAKSNCFHVHLELQSDSGLILQIQKLDELLA